MSEKPRNPYQVPVVEEDEIHASPEPAEQPDIEQDAALLETYRERVCPTCGVAAEAEEVRLRALAEMENFKKRLQREKEEQGRYATETLLASLLPTLDNFELALRYGAQVDACKDVVMGVEMTRKQLLDTLKSHGLESLGREGDPFDPELHEAVGQEECAGLPAGQILQVMQKGYKLRDRLLRPAKVTVSK